MSNIGINDLQILNFDVIDSTSTYLKVNSEHLNNLTVIFADDQTNGHGRLSRKWIASKGRAILFSILIKDKKIIENFSKLSLLCGNIVFKFLSKYTNGLSIKWPNDVYLNNKKIAGILLESKSDNDGINSLVLGIGININNPAFPEDLKEIATSLYLETNKEYDLELLKNEFLTSLIEGLNSLINDDDSYLDNVRKNNYLINKEVYALIDSKKVKVLVKDINDDNTLQVVYKNRIYNLSVGEVVKA